MNNKKILTSIFILALFLRIIFALIVPVFEKPDEKAHFEYIEFLSINKRLPVQEATQIHAEFFQVPFYHFLASFIYGFVKMYTQNLGYQVFFLRLFSVLISMFTLYFIYKIALLLFKDETLSLGVIAFAAFLPSHINFNSNITNSNLADLLASSILYIILLIIIKGENIKRTLLLGVMAGLALITRISLLSLTIAIPFAFFVKHYPNIKKAIKPVVLVIVIASLISGWIFVRNYHLYGDFLGINAMKLASPPDNIKVDFIFIARLLGWTFVTFWASFGRTNGIFIGSLASQSGITIFALSYLILLVFSLSSMYGLYLFFKQYLKNHNMLTNIQKKFFIVSIFYLALLIFSFISFNLYDFQPQGRLLYPAISIISILFTLGIYNLFKRLKFRRFLSVYIISFMIINIMSTLSVIKYY